MFQDKDANIERQKESELERKGGDPQIRVSRFLNRLYTAAVTAGLGLVSLVVAAIVRDPSS